MVQSCQRRGRSAVTPVTAWLMVRAMQSYSGGGLTEDTLLPHLWTWARILRLADGPDEVHKAQLARMEIGKHA